MSLIDHERTVVEAMDEMDEEQLQALLCVAEGLTMGDSKEFTMEKCKEVYRKYLKSMYDNLPLPGDPKW